MTKPRFRGAWEREFRAAAGLPKGMKVTGLTLATFANDNGSNARPGHENLAVYLEYTQRYVGMNLADLVRLGWIAKDSVGSLAGVRGSANVYRLTFPPAYLAWQKQGKHWKQVSRGGPPPGVEPPETGFSAQGKYSSDTAGNPVPPTEEVIQEKNNSPASLQSAAHSASVDDAVDEQQPQRFLHVIEDVA